MNRSIVRCYLTALFPGINFIRHAHLGAPSIAGVNAAKARRQKRPEIR